MKRLYSRLILTALVALAALPAVAETPDFNALVKEVDRISNFDKQDFSGVFTVVTDKPGKKQAISQIRMFRRDVKKQFLILIQLPEADKGQGYLKEGDNLYFYDPVSRKFNHTSMKEALADSEAESEDFNSDDTLEDYAVQGGVEGMVGKIPVWVVTLKAKRSDVSYDMMRLHIRKDRPLVLKEEFLSVSGRLMRTILIPKYAEVPGGKFFASQMLIIDEINKGEKSQVTMQELSVEPLPDKVFTKAFLESAN